jgi:tryptophan synthase beta chain
MITDLTERERLLTALLERRLPDRNGRFGPFGGRYVPETLMPALARLEHGVANVLPSPEFQRELVRELTSWVGRPTALTHARTLSKSWGAEVWLKREDLAHTGAHKINNGIGQALLAKALGAKRVVAETGAGQHGVASAAACARVGLPCTVYMGEIDVARQAPNVDRMRRFGATVVAVKTGGQALLAIRLGKRRIVAETGAGQHGVATATVCARFGLECHVYMGEEDIRRQHPNVVRMRMLGAELIPVTSGSATLKDAMNEAIRDWITNVETTHYLIGSAAGPHPYPVLVRDLQAVIGREARAQLLEQGGLPDAAFACVGGGSNAIGLFHGFLADRSVALYGVEAGGRGSALGEHSATLSHGKPGVLHGTHTMLLYDANGQIQETHSVSAGLDYPGVGPEHAFLQSIGRVEYVTASDAEALAALAECCAAEGILPALESSHALAGAKRWAEANRGKRILIGLSGRGDKDMPILAQYASDTAEVRRHAAA